MKIIAKFVAMFALVLTSTLSAQEFQGVATYKTSRKLNIQIDSTKVNSAMHEQMMEMLKKQFQKTFILTFDKESSIYKEDEVLEQPQVGGTTMNVVMLGDGASDILYKNTKENRFSNYTDLYGKIFLVKDSIETIEWTLENETKNIGQYTCFKATFSEEVEVMESGMSINGDKDLSEPQTRTETRVTTAWYTPQIPINNGPARYQGLPGLILEINDGQQTIVCSKIVLNPEDSVDIKEPTKGKVVNQSEFDEIMEKKQQEMMERYTPRNGREGETFQIRIGG